MSAADIHHYVTEVYGTEPMSDSKVRKCGPGSLKKGEQKSMTKYLFRYLKHSLDGKCFSDNEEVKAAVNSCLSDHAADVFEEAFQNLVLREDSSSGAVVTWGRCSLVVKVTNSWSAYHEFEPCTAEDPLCTGAMHVKSVETLTSSRWCSVEVGRGVSIQVSSSSLDRGSKLRGPSPKALE
ncbi:hypothetical protein TNCV_3690881 [Trichonephila clavipes]|nr:hypothetical protein TNCV_3690881 [Trichonephila clavipes]